MTAAEFDDLIDAVYDYCPSGVTNAVSAAITTLRAQLAAETARADRAEAERAAQIEADARICGEYAFEYEILSVVSSVDIGRLLAARDLADLISAQPHDRTALEAAISAAKVAGLGAAADAIWHGPIWGYGGKADGVSLMAAHACRDAILALIDKERE